jgi:hypothetical protein
MGVTVNTKIKLTAAQLWKSGLLEGGMENLL